MAILSPALKAPNITILVANSVPQPRSPPSVNVSCAELKPALIPLSVLSTKSPTPAFPILVATVNIPASATKATYQGDAIHPVTALIAIPDPIITIQWPASL